MSKRMHLARCSLRLVATDWPMDAFVEERRRRVRSYNTQPCRLGFTASAGGHTARRQRAVSGPGAESAGGGGSVKGYAPRT